ncbi:MAG: hypothetical protein ACE14W_07305 [Candidatus Velamenicoccus archaeovorus]
MHLTWRDGVATIAAAVGAVLTLAVARSWDWPLLGSYRMGVIALFLVAQPMCRTGGAAFWTGEAVKHPALVRHDPLLATTMALGAVATVLVVVGLVMGTRGPFLVLAGVMGLMWLLTTLRHAIEAAPRLRPLTG